MFALNPLTSSFYPQAPEPNQDVKTPFEASLNAYSFFGIHGVKENQELRLEAVEGESFVREEEILEQRKKQEEKRRITLWNSKYAKKYEGEARVEKVNPVRSLVPVARPVLVQPVLIRQPVIIVIPVQIVYVYLL